MLKPERLHRGDTVAIVSLSQGMLGEPQFIHKYKIAKKRLEEDFGLRVLCMDNARRGVEYLYRHPEARAEDWMNAFRNPEVRGIFNAIGGDDTIRLLPYIDFSLIRRNPKIFTGFSDTTANHFMCYHARLVSYYGASVINNFSEYVRINPYTESMIRRTLFQPEAMLDIPSAPFFRDDDDERIWWCEENRGREKTWNPEPHGYEILQGSGIAEGELLGGCLDTFIQLFGTAIWPPAEQWRGKILFLETSEMDMSCDLLCWILRSLLAQGILQAVNAILVGKPARRGKYEPYKEVFRRVVGIEAGRPELPILYNVNFGHAEPIGIFPYGLRCRLDADRRTLTLLEPATR